MPSSRKFHMPQRKERPGALFSCLPACLPALKAAALKGSPFVRAALRELSRARQPGGGALRPGAMPVPYPAGPGAAGALKSPRPPSPALSPVPSPALSPGFVSGPLPGFVSEKYPRRRSAGDKLSFPMSDFFSRPCRCLYLWPPGSWGGPQAGIWCGWPPPPKVWSRSSRFGWPPCGHIPC